MLYPKALAQLIEEFSKLPGIGPKGAQRIAYHLLRVEPADVRHLARTLTFALEEVRQCSVCRNFTDQDPCSLCADPGRDRALLLVVEQPKDVVALERTREYKGLYHVLGGAISPMEGIGPDELHIEALLQRIEEAGFQEVILATDPDVEGEATALYIARMVHREDVRVTRIARGLPSGADLDFADEVTIVRALQGRHPLV